MIGKLKRKFTLLATISMFLLMAALVLIMNLVNYSSVVAETDTVLDMLSRPDMPFAEGNTPPEQWDEHVRDFIPRGMSPEVPYESRYFSVVVTETGETVRPNFSRIISVDNDSAKEYIEQAVNSGKERGFIGQFRFLRVSEGRLTRYLFLDCGRRLDAFNAFLWTSVSVGIFGCLAVFLIFLVVSGRIVKPIAESYEKQKRFISDAGHEIKTPLTIINANVDLMECDGETEELSEIRRQTGRLTELTNNLVLLSKMEEVGHTLQKIEMPLSDIVGETAASFRALTEAANIDFTAEVTPNLTAEGAPDSIRQLVSILMENAVKYSPAGGWIALSLTTGRKTAVLSVFNTTAEAIREEELKYVFDRFYRTDASRNSETGGHGLGLSIAKAITEAHGGSISAMADGPNGFRITANLPIK